MLPSANILNVRTEEQKADENEQASNILIIDQSEATPKESKEQETFEEEYGQLIEGLENAYKQTLIETFCKYRESLISELKYVFLVGSFDREHAIAKLSNSLLYDQEKVKFFY